MKICLMKYSISIKIILLIILINISNSVFSQDTVRLYKDTIPKTLNEVLVTSVRADKKIPITQKTIGDTTIQDGYQGQEIPELLSTLPSMSSNSDGGHVQGYSYLSLRGVSQSRINMTLNGVPLNEPEDHGVYTSNFPSFINSIQSIQIQRGVGSSSNGTASFVGSINFQNKDGLKKGNELQIGFGSYNTIRFNFLNSTGLSKKKMAWFMNIGGVSTDGFRYNSGSIGGSIFIGGGYYGQKRITKINLFSGISKNYMAWDGTPDSVLAIDYRTNQRGNDNPDLFTQSHLQLQNINIFSKKSKLTSTIFFNYLKGHYDVYNIKDVNLIGYYAKENQNSNWIGYISQYDYTIKNLRISIGISANSYVRNHKGIEFYNDTTSFNYKNSGNKNEISGFLKISFDADNITYYVDLQKRYVEFKYKGDVSLNTQSWSFLNPKFGFKVFINNKFNYYYALGVSYREPTRSVMFNGGMYLTQFNSVKPEDVVDYELGLEYHDSRTKFQSNVFYMDFRNEIIPIGPLGSNSLPTMVNVDKSARYGLESDLEYKLTDEFTYSMNSTISNSTYGKNAKHQIFSPVIEINHSIGYVNNNFSFDLNQTYFSRSYMDLDNKYTTPGYSLLGFNIGYKFKECSITFQGNNLTNIKYYSNGYVSNGVKYLYANALYNYYLTIKKNF